MFKINLIESELKEDEGIQKCKGLHFRCSTGVYRKNKGGFESKISMNPLKRMSCSGCPKCDGMEDTIDEDIDCVYFPSNPVNNGIYRMVFVPGFVNEDGFIDDYSVRFEKIEGVK